MRPGHLRREITDTTSGERRATVLGDTLHSAIAMPPPRALRNASKQFGHILRCRLCHVAACALAPRRALMTIRISA